MSKFLLTVVFLYHSVAWLQESDTAIMYTGGYKKLNKIVFKYLSQHNGLFASAGGETARKSNKYFTVLLKIEKNGAIGDDIVVNASNDSTILPIIVDAVKQTNGKWLNRSGTTKWVVLPIYYLYVDDSLPKEKTPPMKTWVYTSANKDALIYLEKIIIEMYPAVS